MTKYILIINLTLLIIHELDAIKRKEWKMFFLLKDLSEEVAYRIFTLLHIPFLMAILYFLISGTNLQQNILNLCISIFLVFHGVIHYLFRKKESNKFTNGFSNIIIYSMSIIAMLSLYFLIANNTSAAQSFDNTLTEHFNAIKTRDINKLMQTVNNGNLTLILPNGVIGKTSSEYRKINEDWFSEKNWQIETKLIDSKIIDNIGYATVQVNYTDIDEKNEKYSFKYYLHLIFERKEDGWKLIYDQNTIIREKI